MIDVLLETVCGFTYTVFIWAFWCIATLIFLRVLYELIMAICIIVAWVRLVNNSCDKRYDRYEAVHDWDPRYYD